MDFQKRIISGIVFAAYGAVYAIIGYIKRNPDVEPNPRMFVKPIIIGLVAGLIASTQADSPDAAAIQGGLGVAVPLVDSLFNQYLPPSWGGKPDTKTSGPQSAAQ